MLQYVRLEDVAAAYLLTGIRKFSGEPDDLPNICRKASPIGCPDNRLVLVRQRSRYLIIVPASSRNCFFTKYLSGPGWLDRQI